MTMTLDEFVCGSMGQVVVAEFQAEPTETAHAFATYRQPLAITVAPGGRYHLAACPTCGSHWTPWAFANTWRHSQRPSRDCWLYGDGRHFANDWATFDRLRRGNPQPTAFVPDAVPIAAA